MFYFSSLELVHDLCHEVNFLKSNNKGPQLIKFNAVNIRIFSSTNLYFHQFSAIWL